MESKDLHTLEVKASEANPTPQAPKTTGDREGGEQRRSESALNAEHEALGALWGTLADGSRFVSSYGQEPGGWEAAHESCALAELGDLATILIGGAQTQAFVAAVFSQPAPAPGDLRYALVLAGDGSVVAPVLLGTVAADDVVVWVPKGLEEGLRTWLLAMAALSSDEGALWPELSIDDAVEGLVSLALMGKASESILSNYVAAQDSLPAKGSMKHLLLDAIPTTCLNVPALRDMWVVFVPGARAAILWRSLLSFPLVQPVGTPVFWGRVVESNQALEGYLKMPIRRFYPADLGLEGLLRAQGGFVGARALGIGTSGASCEEAL